MDKVKGNPLQCIALAYMMIWAISPPLGYGTVYRLVFIVCFAVWEFIAFLRKGRQLLRKELLIAGFLLILLGLSFLDDGSGGIRYNIQFFCFVLFSGVYLYYSDGKEDTRWILLLVMLIVILWDITTLRGYTMQRNVSRLLAKDFEGAEEFSAQGIGGYGYVYFLTFLTPILEGMLICCWRKWNPLVTAIDLICLVLSLAVIVMAGYSIALLLTFFAVILVLLVRRIRHPIILLLITVMLLAVLFVNMEDILMKVSELTAGTMYERKVNDILLTIRESEMTGTLEERMERYLRSIRLFFDSPLLGQGSRADVGKHSAILDRYAQFGFFVGFGVTVLLTWVQREMVKRHIDDGLAYAMFIITLAFFLMNNVALIQGVALYVVYPAAMEQIREAKRKTDMGGKKSI